MTAYRQRSLQRIEEQLQKGDNDPLRVQALESAKRFKTSWIELGQVLYSVWKDRRFKEWGYTTFDAYTAREVGIRKATAMKLVRSYFFLEKEEPGYLRPENRQGQEPARIPSYESIDVLRMAKARKELDREDYARLKEGIFEKGMEARQARQDLTQLIRSRAELSSEDAWEEKKTRTLKRLIGMLSSLKNEVRGTKLISAQLVKDTEDLIRRLRDELGS